MVTTHNPRIVDTEMISYVFSLADENTWEIAVEERAHGAVVSMVRDFCRAMGPGLKDKVPDRRLIVEGRDPNCISLVCVGVGGNPGIPLPKAPDGMKTQGPVQPFSVPDGISERISVADMAYDKHMRILLMPVWGGCIEAGAIPIHGALLDRLGNGIVLIGRSGAGKTTCCRRLPKGWTVLGDDLAMLRPIGRNEYRAQPLPTWSAMASGTVQWPCRANTSVSLRALFLLDQSDNDEALPMGALQAAAAIQSAAQQALLGHGPRSYWKARKRLERVLDTAVRIARSVPAYRLRVSLHGRFWEKIEEVLENGDSPLFRCETGEQKTA